MTALDEVATAIGALVAFGKNNPLEAVWTKRLLAFMPGYHTAEQPGFCASLGIVEGAQAAVKYLRSL